MFLSFEYRSVNLMKRNRQIICSFIFIAFLVTVTGTALASDVNSVHNINKGTDYASIQAAVYDANSGDEIHVDSGTYSAMVEINKNLTLIGAGADKVKVISPTVPVSYTHLTLPTNREV